MMKPNKGREKLRRSLNALFERRTRSDDPNAITAPQERSAGEKDAEYRYYQRHARKRPEVRED